MPVDDDFSLKLSIILLCFLSLLWTFVVLLFFWLRRIHQRVDKAYKDWNVYPKLVHLDVKENEIENVTEIKNTYTLPLVITNKRAENSEASKSWKDIDRTFAYALTDHEESESLSGLEGASSSAAQEEVETAVDCKDTQGESTQRDLEDVTPASGVKIVNDGSTMLFLSGRHPADDHIGGRRIFKTLKSAQGNEEVCGKLVPSPKERIVLVEAKHFIYEKEANCLSNGTVVEQSHGNDTSYFEAVSELNGVEPAPGIPLLGKERNTAGKIIVDGDKLSSKHVQEHQVVPEPSTLPRRDGEAKTLISTESKPKGKGNRKRKRPAERNTKDKHRENSEHTKPSKNADEDEQGDLTSQHSKNKVAENDGDKTGIKVVVNQGQICSNMGALLNHQEGDENNYDCITTPPNETHAKSELGNKDTWNEDISEDIYSNIDDNIAGSCEKSFNAHPESQYVNLRNAEHVDEEFLDDALIYSNAAAEQNSTSPYDNPGFVYDEGPVYVNIKEMFHHL